MTEATYLSNQIDIIRAALMRFAGTRQTGSQLRALIDSAAPGIDIREIAGVPVGPGALTKLLASNFSDIAVPIGKAGGDNLYFIGSSANEFSNQGGEISPALNIWTAFASPDVGVDVLYNKENKSLSVRSKDSMNSEEELRISSVSPEEFRQIAETFSKTAPKEFQQELTDTINQNDFAFHKWISVLRRGPAGLYQDWGQFRIQKFAELFRQRLSISGLPEQQIEDAVHTLRTEQSIAFKLRTQATLKNANQTTLFGLQKNESELNSDINDAREIAKVLINYMSMSEIRQISVPLGAIIDARLVPRK